PHPLRSVLPLRRPPRGDPVRGRILAAHALPGCHPVPAATDRQPDAVEGLLPGGDAILRRELGVERMAVSRRQPAEAPRAETGRTAAARTAGALPVRGAGCASRLRVAGLSNAASAGPDPGNAATEGDRWTPVPAIHLRRRGGGRRLGRGMELRRGAPG